MEFAEFSTQLEEWLPLADGDVVNQIPFVVVFFGRQPVVGADLAVAAQAKLWQAAVQGGGWIIAADAERFVFVGVGIGLSSRSYQAAKADARFVHYVGREDMRPTEDAVAAKVLFAVAVEAAAIEGCPVSERRDAALGGIAPTDRSEDAVGVVEVVIDAAVALIGIKATGRDGVVIVRGDSPPAIGRLVAG